jgi:hypothetical protein
MLESLNFWIFDGSIIKCVKVSVVFPFEPHTPNFPKFLLSENVNRQPPYTI